MIKRSTKIIFTKKKKLFKIDEIDFDNILVSKKPQNHMVQKIHLNTSLDIMMMMALDQGRI